MSFPGLPLGSALELSSLSQPTLAARHAGWRLRLSPFSAAPPGDFSFVLVAAPNGDAACVGLRASTGPAHLPPRYVRVRPAAAEVWVDADDGDAGWAAQASWRLAPGLAAAPGAASIESALFPSFFLRANATDGACVVAPYDGSAACAGDATFILAPAGGRHRGWHVAPHARMAAPAPAPLPAPVRVSAPLAAAPSPSPSPSPVGLHVNVCLRAHGEPALAVRRERGRGRLAGADGAAYGDVIFEIVPALDGAADAVSLRGFAAPASSALFLRVRPEAAEVHVDADDGAATFATEASWRVRAGHADAAAASFETCAFAGFFLAGIDGGLLSVAAPAAGSESRTTFVIQVM